MRKYYEDKGYLFTNWGDEFKPAFTKNIGSKVNIEISPNGMYMLGWDNGGNKISVLNLFQNKEKSAMVRLCPSLLKSGHQLGEVLGSNIFFR